VAFGNRVELGDHRRRLLDVPHQHANVRGPFPRAFGSFDHLGAVGDTLQQIAQLVRNRSKLGLRAHCSLLDASGTPDALYFHVRCNRILVPVDFSPQSDAALEYAIDLARRLDGRIVLAHVFSVPAFAFPDASIPMPAQTVVEVQNASRTQLAKLEERVRQAGVGVSSCLLEGAPFVEIVRAARGEQADLIVMGTHGRSGLRHALLGSVAEKVVRKAPCPVLVVRPPGHEFEHP
jgi:nucleotide-binding universal stress UspA family protein